MSPTKPRIAALIVAAGDSARMGEGVPKPYRILGGKPVLRHSAALFATHPAIAMVQVVRQSAHDAYYQSCTSDLGLLPPVEGGATRQASVFAGLEALAEYQPDMVLIHDAARPFLSTTLIDRLLAVLETNEAVIPALPVTDTIKQRDGDALSTLDRNALVAAQTPQAFHFEAIVKAHRRFAGHSMTDDAAIAEECGFKVALVEGERANRKLTYAGDLEMMMETRTGMGFDVHRLEEHGDGTPQGQHVMHLGGVAVPSHWYLAGHSDADVIIHAAVDAMLGAVAMGDIGQHFPPSEARWKGASSAIFLEHAVTLLAEKGARLVHLDVTVIGEKPKIAPHREAIRQRMAEIIGCDVARISIKATTTEGLGFTGRGEGLAAQAVATIELPRHA